MKVPMLLMLLSVSLNTLSQTDQTKTEWANLKKYAMENKKLNPPASEEKRVVFMGNSITEMWKSTDSSFFKNKPYINRGISGQVTEQMLLRFQQDVVDLKPEVVVILAGINDIAENNGPITLEEIYKNIVSMAELAKANNIQVVLSSILPANEFVWRQRIKPADKIIELNSMIEFYCKANNIVYCNYYSKMVNDKKGLDRTLSYDGVHATLAGYKVMEPIVEEAISKALQKK